MSGSGKLTHDLFDPVTSKPKTGGFHSFQVMEVNSIGGQGSYSSMINSFKETTSGSNIFDKIDLSGISSNIYNLHTDDLITVSYQQIQYNKDSSGNYYADDVTYGQLKWVGKVTAIDNDNSVITISTDSTYQLTGTIIQTLTSSGYNNTDANGTSSNFLLYDSNNGSGAKELKATYNNTSSGASTPITTYFFFQKRGGAVNMNAGLMITNDDLTSTANNTESLTVAGDVILGNDTDVDRVTVNGKTSLKGVTTVDSTLTVSETSTFKGTVSLESKLDVAKSATFDSTLYVGGATTINAAVSLKGTLDIEQAVTMDSTLYVANNLTLGGNITNGTHTYILPTNKGGTVAMTSDVSTITGATTLDSTLYVSKGAIIKGFSSLDSKLNVKKEATFNSTVSVDGAVSLKDTLDIEKATTMDSTLFIGKSLTVTEDATVNGSIDVSGATTVDQTLYVGKTTTMAGAVSLTDTLDVEKATTFDSTLYVGKSVTVKEGAVLQSTLTTTGAATMDSTLYVAETVTLKKATSIGGILDVTGDTTLDADLRVGETATVIGYTSLESKLNVKKAATFDSTVYVTGTSKLKGAVSLIDTLDVEKASTFDSTLYVGKSITVKEGAVLQSTLATTGAATMDDTLYVAETATIKKATSIEGILDVSGAVTLDSSLRVGKKATIVGYTSLESKLNVKKAATFDSTVYVEGVSNLKGAVTMDGKLDVVNAATMESTLYVGGATTLNGAASFKDTLDIVKAVTMDSTLYVSKTSTLIGATSLKDILDVEKAVTMDSTLRVGKTATVVGYTSLESKLNVKKAATFDSTVYVEGVSNLKGAVSLTDTLDVASASTFDSTLYVGKTMTVKEGTNLSGTLDVSGATTVDQTLYVGKTTTLAGAVTLTDTLDVEKASTFDSTLYVGKTITVKEGAVLQSTLSTTGAATMDDTLYVAKTATIKKATSIEGILDVSGAVTLDSSLQVGKKATIVGYTSLESKLNVKKAATFDSTVYVEGVSNLKGAVTMNGKLDVVNAATMESTLYVGGATTLNGAASFKDTLDIVKAVTMDSTLFVGKTSTLTGATSLKDILDVEKAVTMDSTLRVGKTATVVGYTSLESKLNVKKAATFDSTVYVEGASVVKGAVSMKDKLEVVNAATMESTIYVGETMTVKKATNLDGTLDISGAVTMDNTLYVAETATIKKATSIEGILDVSGATTLDSSLRVGKTTTVIGYTSLESKLNVKKAATFDSTIYVEGASNIKGATSLKDILDVEKAVTMDSTLRVGKTATVVGYTSLESKLNVKKAATFDSTVYVEGASVVKGAVSMKDKLEVVNAATMESTIYVGETMTVKKATNLDGTLDVSGAVTMDKTLYVGETVMLKKATSIEGILDVSGSTTLQGTLDVSGAATIYGALTVQESSTFEKNLDVNQAATIGSVLTLKNGLVSGMGGSAKTLTVAKLGYLSTIESDLQTQLNNLKFTTNKRMYVNDHTVQTAEYTLTIGSDTLDYKYTPNVFALTNTVHYRDLAGQDITFRGKKTVDGTVNGTAVDLLVDFKDCTPSDTSSFAGIVDETGSNSVSNNILEANTGTTYGIHPFLSEGTASVTGIIGINNFKGYTMGNSFKIGTGATITTTTTQANEGSIKGTGGAFNININVDVSGTSTDLSGIGDTDATIAITVDKSVTITKMPSSFSSITTAINANMVLICPSAEISGKTVTGSGTLQISDDAASCDFSNMADTITVQFLETSTFTGDLTRAGSSNSGQYEIHQNATFNITAAKADNKKIVTGSSLFNGGTLNITSLDSTAGADLSNITHHAYLSMDDSFTFTGKFTNGSGLLNGSGKTLTLNNAAALTSGKSLGIASNVTLSSPAANVTGKTLAGAGTVSVTSLENTLGANFSLITTTNVTASMTLSGTSEFTSSANLGDFVVTVGGTGTLTAHASATLPSGTGSFSVGSNVTLQLSAIHSDGLVATGAGTTDVLNLENDLNADLSGITTTTVTAALNASGNPVLGASMKLGDFVVTTSGGSGTVTANASANLTTGTGKFTLGTGTTLEITAAHADGLTIDGAGSTRVLKLDETAGADLSNISSTGDAGTGNLVKADDNVTFTSTFPIKPFSLDGGKQITMSTGGITTTEKVTVKTGTTLITAAANLAGKILDGAGNLTVNNLNGDADADLSGVATTGTNTINVAGNMTFTGKFVPKPFNLDGSGTLIMTSNGIQDGQKMTVQENNSFTADASLVNGKTIDGSGNITINKLDDTAGAILANITNIGSTTVNTAGAVTFTGTFPATAFTLDGDNIVTMNNNSISGTNTVTIASDNTIKATAARVTGKSIIGEGTLDILEIEDTLELDISGVTVTTITGALDSTGNKEFTADAKLSDATITISGNGTVTANASAVMPDGAGGFVVGASATLKLTAIHSDSLIASGGGNMTIDNLNGDAAADLSGISTTGTNTVNTLGNMTFTGKFPVKALTLDGSGALTMTSNAIIDDQLLTISADNSIVAEASLITGKSIGGAGDLTINKLNETAAADLSGISTSGTTIVNNAASSTTFTGTFPATAFTLDGSGTVIMSNNGIPTTNDMTVDSGVTFQSTAANITGKKIKGAGNMTINTLNGDADAVLVNVTTTGTTAVNTSADMTFTGSFPATAFTLNGGTFEVTLDGATITTGKAMTLDTNITLKTPASVLDGKTVNGSGSITYIGDTGGADLSKVDVGTSFSSDSTFTGTLEDGVEYNVASGVTFTITAAKATGKNISGSGTIRVTELENTLDADLSGITVTTFNAFIDSTGNKEFAAAAKLSDANIDISGNGTVTAHADATLPSGSGSGFVVGSSATLQLTATQSHTVPISGSGNMTVTGLENKTNADLSGITTSGTNTVNAGSNTSFSGSFPQANFTLDGDNTVTMSSDGIPASPKVMTIAANNTLQADASKFTSKVVGGAGNFIINNLDATESAALVNITCSGSDNKVNASNSVTFGGSFPNAAFKLDGDQTFTMSSNAITTGKTLTIESSNTLVSTAVLLDGKTIRGSGNITVNAMNSTAGLSDIVLTSTSGNAINTTADLTDFTGTFPDAIFTLQGNNTVTMNSTGIVGTKQVTLNSGNALIANANRMNGRLVKGTGSITVNKLDETPAADLSGITTTGTNTVNAAANVATFSGKFPGEAFTLGGGKIVTMTQDGITSGKTMTIDSGNTLKSTATLLDGKTIGGEGNITVNELNGDPASVLVNITTSGTTIVNNAAEATTFTGSFPNTAFTLDGSGTVTMSNSGIQTEAGKTVTVDTGVTLKSDAVNLRSTTIDGSGSLIMDKLNEDPSGVFSGITELNSVTVNTSADIADFSGSFPATAFTLNGVGAARSVTMTQDGIATGKTMTISSGDTLVSTAVLLDGKTITGTGGKITINSLEGDTTAVLGGIDVSGAIVNAGSTTGFSGTFPNAPFNLSGGYVVTMTSAGVTAALDINSGSGLTSTATLLDGTTISGDGSLIINSLEGDTTAVLAGITVSGTTTVNAGSNTTFAGTFPATAFTLGGDKEVTITNSSAITDDKTITVDGSNKLTSAAANVTGKTISGTGTVDITAIESTLGVDLEKVTPTSLTGTLNSTGNVELGAAAKLSDAVITISGDGIVTAHADATLTSGSFSVGANATLTLTAVHADGLSVSGSGTMNINTLSGNLTANLSSITTTGTTTLTSDANLTFGGSFPNTAFKLNGGKTVTISSSAIQGSNVMTVESESTLTSTAANITGKYITGTGTVNITALESTLGADLSNIDSTTLTAALNSTGGVEFTAAAKLSDAVITVNNAGTVTANASAVMPASPGGFVLDSSSGTPTVELTAAHANSISITGTGNVTVNKLDETAGAVLSGITATGTTTVNAADNVTFTGSFPATTFTLDGDKIVTMTQNGITTGKAMTISGSNTLISTATLLDGKTIGGGGNITVNELNGDAACVLVNITNSGTTIVNNAASETTFTGSFPNTAFTLDGSGTVIMSNSGIQTGAGKTVTIDTGVTLKSDAVKLRSTTIDGSGSLIMDKLNEDPSGVFAGITELSSVTVNTDANITDFSGTFPATAFTLDGSSRTVTMTENGIADSKTMTIGSGNTLISTAALFDAKTITGAGGKITINSLEGDTTAVLGGIDVSGAIVNAGSTTNFSGTFPDAPFNISGGNVITMTAAGITAAVDINSGSGLTSTAALLDGKTISGSGSLIVNSLEGDTTAALVGITVSGTTTVNAGSNTTFAGTFPATAFTLGGDKEVTITNSSAITDDKTITVDGSNKLTSAAANVTGKTISGTGTVDVTAIESTLGVDLSKITPTNLTGTINSTGDVELGAAAKLSDAVITISGNGTVTADASATLPTGSGSFSVGANATLTLTAVHADGLSASGSGTMNINTLSGDKSANLSSITTTGTTTLTSDSNLTFDGNFPGTAFTLNGNKTVTLSGSAITDNKLLTISGGSKIIADAVNIDGKLIGGTGNITINTLSGDLTADFSGVSVTPASGVNEVNTDASGDTFQGTFPNAPFTLNGGSYTLILHSNAKIITDKTMTLDSAITVIAPVAVVSGKTITGSGALTITGDTGAGDLSNITTSTALDSTVNFTGTLQSSVAYTVGSGVSFTATAAKVTGMNISGIGTINVTKLEDTLDADLSGITVSTFNASIDSTGDKEFTAAAKLSDANITISGTGKVTANASATLPSGTGSGFEVGLNATLELTATKAHSLNVSGTGRMIVKSLDGKSDADLSNITTTASAAGVVNIVEADNNVSFSGSFPATAFTLDGDKIVTLTNSSGITTGKTLTVANNNTLKAGAAHLAGKTIEGAGNITVDALNGSSDVDLSGITTSGTNTIITSSEVTFSGKFINANFDLSGGNVVTMTSDAIRTGKTVNIKAGNGLISTAARLSNKTITGSGTITINSIEAGDKAAVLAGIDISGAIVNAGSDTDFSGTFPAAAFTLDGDKTVTITNNNAITTGKTMTIDSGNTLKSTATLLDGKTIDGAGNITVDTLNADNAADLSGITTSGTNTVITNDNVTFTGKFIQANFDLSGGNVVTMTSDGIKTGKTLSVLTGNTLKADAQYLDGKTIDGAGNITVDTLNGDNAADLSGITTSGTNTVITNDNVTFTGKFIQANFDLSGGNVVTMTSDGIKTDKTLTVLTGNTLKANADKLDDKTINGAGSVVVTNLGTDTSAVLAKITSTGTGNKIDNSDFSGSFSGTFPDAAFTLDGSGTLTITNSSAITAGKTMSLNQNAILVADAANVTGKTIDGSGNITVNNLNIATADADLSGITDNGSVTVNAADNITFTGSFPATAFTLDGDKNVTITDSNAITSGKLMTINENNGIISDAANLTGKTIDGSGNITVNKLNDTPAADLSGITNNASVTVNAADNLTFTGSFPATAFTLDGEKTVTMTSTGITDDKTFTIASDNTLVTAASLVNGKTITGSGTITITSLDQTLAADLSKLTADTMTAAFDSTGVFTGTLSNTGSKTLTVNVANGVTLATAMKIAAAGNVVFDDGENSGTLQLNVTADTDDLNKDLQTSTVINFAGMTNVFAHINVDVTMNTSAKFFDTNIAGANRAIKIADSKILTAKTVQLTGQTILRQGTGTTSIVSTHLEEVPDLVASGFTATNMDYYINTDNSGNNAFHGRFEGNISKQIEIHYQNVPPQTTTFYVKESVIPYIVQNICKWCGQSGDTLVIVDDPETGARNVVIGFSSFGDVSTFEISDADVNSGTKYYITHKTVMKVTVGGTATFTKTDGSITSGDDKSFTSNILD